MEDSFDDIRSYRDHEVSEVCKRMLQCPEVAGLLQQMLPTAEPSALGETIRHINSTRDFQDQLMLPIFRNVVLPTFSELTVSGLENLEKDRAYLFISNHRDIVLDSAVLNYFLHTHGHSTAEIAIGDNLLKEKWIEDLVRLNKSFIVKRGGDKVERLKSSRRMSDYIGDTIIQRGESVWIAQRAGRAKDGNDETNPALIGMFAMSGSDNIPDHLRKLHILPVSVSYEYDPCDARKTREICVENEGEEYVKSEEEDVESMKMGIVLPKGRGHIHFGKVLDESLKMAEGEDRRDYMNRIIQEIDQQIQSNYKIWPSNLIANAILSQKDSRLLSENEKENFIQRMEESLKEVGLDHAEAKEVLLSMYQQPLLNKEKWV